MAKNESTVVFDINGCRIYSKNKKIIAEGKLIDDLYKVKIKTSENACAVKNAKNDEALLWHRRLGHASFNKMKSVLDIDLKSDMKCVVCAEGKHARLPFNETGTRASKCVDIIHSDVCGPLPTRSVGGSLYFVTFIDDFSRKVAIATLKSKSEVFSKFVEFKSQIENEK